MRKILIWCHGGCFSGGSIEYDKELRNYLIEKQDWQVIPVDFSLTNWNVAIDDVIIVINNIIQSIRAIHENGNASTTRIILGGISSGGLLAHHVANLLNLPALLICPVIKPADRHFNLPEDLQMKQLKFFNTMENMKIIQDTITQPNNKRYILYGNLDNRAPLSGFKEWLLLDNVFYDEINKGHEICNNPDLELITIGLNKLIN